MKNWGFTKSVGMILFIVVLFLMTGSQIAYSQETTSPSEQASSEATDDDTATKAQGKAVSSSCNLSPIVVPTLPEKIPGYTELDPDTQLHMTGTPQEIALESYELEITGKVKQPLKLKYDDLRCMPKIEARPPLICPGFFQDMATWAGVPLEHVLELADLQEGAKGIKLLSADKYSTAVLLSEALSGDNFLAYEWEGEPIPILHGFPIRAIFPQLLGNKWVKWLVKIEVY
jgi:DMSO/TMAO reductase YedYZ molybdopterin-dependent catalytic subunit